MHESLFSCGIFPAPHQDSKPDVEPVPQLPRPRDPAKPISETGPVWSRRVLLPNPGQRHQAVRMSRCSRCRGSTAQGQQYPVLWGSSTPAWGSDTDHTARYHSPLLCFTFEFGHCTHDQLTGLSEALNGPLQLRGNWLWDRGLCRLAAEGEKTQRGALTQAAS